MTQTQEAPTFAGFDPAHTTPIPNALIDELLTVLSWDELKVFLYITRRTKGFGKEKDAISLAQFTDGITTKDGRVLDSGCGVKNRARVVDARDSLKEGGYINFEQVTRGNGHGATVYSICYRGSDATVPTSSDATVPTQPSTSDATVPTSSDATVPTGSDATVPHNIQLTKDSRQEIVITDAIASTPAPAVSTSGNFSGGTPQPAKEKPAKSTRKQKEVVTPDDLLAAAPPDVQAIVQEWRGIFTNKPVAVTPKLIEQATLLVGFKPEPGEIKACRAWMYKTDTKKWYSTHGMHLGDVAREFERFRSLASIPEQKTTTPTPEAAPPVRKVTDLRELRREMEAKYGKLQIPTPVLVTKG